MIKTLVRSIKQEKEKFRIPHSVQDAIPVKRIWTDGIFQTGNAYSRSYRLTDINYAIASKADKTAMLLGYSELLNALDSGASAKITINNRRVDRRQFEQELLIRPQADKLNGYRQEYNDMLCSHAASNNNVVQERYLTINAHKRSVDEARAYFQRMGGEVTARLGQLSSQAEELDASARLQILRDFFKAGQPAVVPFNMEQRAKRGHDFKDWFCPDSLEFYADFFKSDIRWGRVLYLQDYASFIKDDFIMELCELDRSMMVSIDILPVPTDEAVRELQNKLLGVETNVANWQRRQNNANNYTANVPYDMQLQRKETTEFLNDLTERDQRMMYGLVTVVHLAGTKEQLDAWATGHVDLEAWDRSFREHHTLVALEDGAVIGFGDIDGSGYLDRLYVHRRHQGKGVATALCDRLEQVCAGVISTHASITAKPFFEKRGYRVIREQQVERQGVALTNFVMERRR